MSAACTTMLKRKRSVGKWIVQRIFGPLVQSYNSETALQNDELKPTQNSDGIRLKLPNLYQTIRILQKPDIMVGQAYVDGYWAVQPQRLFDFLYLIRSQEDSKLQKWF